MPTDVLRIGAALVAAMLLAAPLPARAQDAAGKPVAIGIAEIDYTDSSGEPTDQQAAHADRLKHFVAALHSDLDGSGKYRSVTLDCGPDPCSVADQIPADLIAAAKKAGARLLLYGGVHKESTLIQFMKAEIVDLDADKLVLERLITFRGDNDEAWVRAEKFLMKELLATPLVN